MKRLFILPFLFCFITTTSAQIQINIGVDTTTAHFQSVEAFLNRYITDFQEDNQVDYSEYFYAEDADSFFYPDKKAFGLIGDLTSYYMGTPYLLQVDAATDTINAKLMFTQVDSNQKVTMNFIANYFIKIENGECRFLMNQKVETRDWKQTKMRNITFHYPPYHKFNRARASSLISAIVELEEAWGLQPIPIDYYFARTNQEIQTVKGFDFNFYMTRSERPGGMAYEEENSIFCWGYDEAYLHEFIHLYLNPLYPQSPLLEGIATFYGGSLGRSFPEHLVRLNAYLKEHPEIDASDPMTFYYMDEDTNPQYALQALICHLFYVKEGTDGLKAIMQLESMDEVYRELGIAPEFRNDFLRDMVEEFSTIKE